MLDAARDVRSFVAGRRRADLDSDRALAYAIVRGIEVIGEAATRVSSPIKAAHNDVPWAMIVAMRNRLIHAYHDVNLDMVWKTVIEDLPPLIASLESILRAPDVG